MAKESPKVPEGKCGLEVDGKAYTFRRPTLDEYEDYQEKMSSTKRRGPCYRELAQRCLETPSLEELQAVFAKYPGVSARIADSLADMAGADMSLTVGKG